MGKDLESVIFYSIEKTIKVYRQFAQKELKKKKLNITVDQWLILKSLSDHPKASQKELAERVFKDAASVTRIIDLLVNAGHLLRSVHSDDQRRNQLHISKKGKTLIEKTQKVVDKYRARALKHISTKSVKQTHNTLHHIIRNCN